MLRRSGDDVAKEKKTEFVEGWPSNFSSSDFVKSAGTLSSCSQQTKELLALLQESFFS
jgi:hypothetical protein